LRSGDGFVSIKHQLSNVWANQGKVESQPLRPHRSLGAEQVLPVITPDAQKYCVNVQERRIGRMKNSMTQSQQGTRTRTKALLAGVTLALAMSACSTIENVRNPEPPFNLAAHAVYLQGGLAVVQGTVNAGDAQAPQTCFGHQVYLLPDTPFFQYKARRIGNGDDIGDVGLEDDRYDHLVRHVACGRDGSYSIGGLPEASWIVLTTLAAPKGAQGPALRASVTTKGSDTARVNLDQSNLTKK
jgi:hypothetical protein